MIDEINKILSDWDPINLGYPLSLDEYKDYAQRITFIVDDREKLRKYLVESLEQMGLIFDADDRQQKDDIDRILEKLIELKH